MRTIVFSLGFDITSVIARLSEIGLTGKEHLIFVTPMSSSLRSEASQKTLENHIAVLNSRGFKLTYEFLAVDEDDATKAIVQIYNKLAKHQSIFVELSGGLRYLILVTFIAAMILRDRVESVSTRLESNGRCLEIPLPETRPLSTPDVRVLEILKISGLQNQRDLASSVGRKVSSISRSLSRLRKMGYVNSTSSHPSIYSISLLGEVLLREYETNAKSKGNSQSTTDAE